MNLTSLTFLTFGKLQASLIFRSLKRKVNSAHLAYRKRSTHSHIAVFSCSVPFFSQLCPIIVPSILGLSVESLVTYWGVDHVCARTECFVRKWFSLKPRCKDTTSPQTNHTFLYVSCDSRTFLSRVCGSGMFVFLMLHEFHILDRSAKVVENKPFRRMPFMNKRFSFSCFSCFLRGTYFTPYIYIIDY